MKEVFSFIDELRRSAFGTKLPIRDVRSSVATGGKPDMAQTVQFGRE
jgi:hypothetical protein